MATLVERAIGAARLDPATYEEVEHDPTALGQAMTVVVVAAVATGIGSAAAGDGGGGGVAGLVGHVLASLVGWFIWAGLVYLIGTKMLPGPETQSDMGELLRTIGFAASPGVLGILGVVPLIGGLILVVSSLWQLATMVVAVRQALDYEGTGRSIAVCVIGFVVYMLVAVVLVATLLGAGMTTSGGAGGSMAP